MGSNNYSHQAYEERAQYRAQTSTPTFDHHAKVVSGAAPRAAHAKVDPKQMKNGLRECRDSDNHPETLAIAVGLDVTGSMEKVPGIIQSNLPKLMTLLLDKGYVAHPSIAVSAFDDAGYESLCFQFSQFESDIEIDEAIRSMVLTQNGGGNGRESSDLFLFTLARCVKMDCWEKRQKKGYAFIIGDEGAYDRLHIEHVVKAFGSEMGLKESLTFQQLIDEVQERWNLYYILPNLTSYWDNETVWGIWKKTLGERFIRLEDPAGISEMIAGIIGIEEETTDTDSLVNDMTDVGTAAGTASAVSRALVTLGANKGGAVSKLVDGKTGLVAP